MIPFPFQVGGVGRASDGGASASAGFTLNPSDKSSTVALSNGNLRGTKSSGGAAHVLVRATAGKASGKWYWEVRHISGMVNSVEIAAITKSGVGTGTEPGASADGYGYNGVNGVIYNTGVSAGFGAVFDGEVIGIALNMDDLEVEFFKTNVSQALITGIAAGTWFPTVGFYDQGGIADAMFTSSSQTYAPPAGFSAIGD